jgi:hypothetical protein
MIDRYSLGLQGGMQIKQLGVRHFGAIGVFGERRKEAVPLADHRKTRPERIIFL